MELPLHVSRTNTCTSGHCKVVIGVERSFVEYELKNVVVRYEEYELQNIVV
jgi:hypothetical protein